MKKIIKIFLIFCVLSRLMPVYVFAANNSYYIEDLGMSIDIPDDYVVFTREIEENDPNLSSYGLTKDELTSIMFEKNIYFNALDDAFNNEIVVTMIDTPLKDFNQFSDTFLNILCSSMSKEYENVGINYINSEIYNHQQAKFVKLYISQPSDRGIVYGLSYYTVYNGKAINITLHSYSGEIDSQDEIILSKIVDTIHFDVDPQFNTFHVQTESFIYTDKESGISFTVPANWVETPMIEEREFLDAKFSSNLESAFIIAFCSIDIYGSEELMESLSLTEHHFLTRKNIDNDIFTKADIAIIAECEEKDISMVTYSGKEYYKAETTTSEIVDGITITMPIVHLIRCESGYFYYFCVNAPTNSEYFQDFESLVNSTEYPYFETEEAASNKNLIICFFIVCISICILTIFIFILSKKKKNVNMNMQKCNFEIKKDSFETKNELISDIPNIEENFVVEDFTMELDNKKLKEHHIEKDNGKKDKPVTYCYRCGNKLTKDSLFCNQCGTRIPIIKEE